MYVCLFQNYILANITLILHVNCMELCQLDKYELCIFSMYLTYVYFELDYASLLQSLSYVMKIYFKLHALDLIKTLDDMHKEKKFAKV